MAIKGMIEFRANGEDYTINDPNIAEEFDPTKAYHEHDHVYYQGNLYVFVAEHAAGTWNTSHVLLIKVGAELANLWNANATEATLRANADNDLKSAIHKLIHNVTMTVIENNYLNTAGYFASTSGYSVSIARCNPEDAFVIKRTSEHSSMYYGINFLNSSFQIIDHVSGLEQDTPVTDVTIICPANSAYIAVNNTDYTDFDGQVCCKVSGVSFEELTGIFFDDGETINNVYFEYPTNHYVSANGYKSIEIKCDPGDVFKISGMGYGANAPASPTFSPWIIRNSNHEIIDSCRVFRNSYPVKVIDTITIPENGAELIVSTDTSAWPIYLKKYGYPKETKEKSWLAGKKIVWFGTSIPAGVVNGKSYPQMVADNLGAIVYNESLGSSQMSLYNKATDCLVRSLAPTYAEKQEESWFSGLSEANKALAQSSAYDYKFTKYLTGGSIGPVDLYVFDHGYNDYYYIDDTDFMTEPADPNDKSYPLGAANFLISAILNDNPRAKIVWIGHYENALDDPTDHQSWGKPVTEFQEYISNKYGIPICKVWESTGWSNPNKITTTGFWQNGYWQNSGGASRQDYVKNCAFADGIHPYSDKSGESNEKVAEIITKWLKNLY